ncbi:MAG: acyl-CoA dehydrogenase family protein [Acidimicrobiales bacterium]
MPESLPPELIELQRIATELACGPLTDLRRQFDHKEAGSGPERAISDRAALRDDVVAASTSAGIFGMTQASVTGEPAASALALAVVREALARHDVVDLPGLFGPTPGLLADVGEPIRSQYLEPLLAGKKQGGFGFTEPDGAPRHTWAAVDGDDLIVNGQKSYVTGGADADFVNTLVEVDGIGPAMVLIDTGTPGVTITRRFESLDGSHHAAFQLADVRVPRAHIIGEAGKGMSRAIEQVGQVRMAIAATSVGLTAFVVDHVERYLRAPHRTGTPLGQSERHRLRYGDMRIRAFAARSVLYRTARLIDSGENAVNETMAAKHIATETVGHVVDRAIQTVGGQALTDGHPLQSIHRRVRSLRLAEGTSDVLAMNIARGRLDLDRGRL